MWKSNLIIALRVLGDLYGELPVPRQHPALAVSPP